MTKRRDGDGEFRKSLSGIKVDREKEFVLGQTENTNIS